MGDGFSTASNWVTVGQNSNSTVDSETSGMAEDSNTFISSGLEVLTPGTAGHVRHECHVWMDEDGDVAGNAAETPSFNWNVRGDFTVVLNAVKNTVSSDPGDVDVDIFGSVDGTNYAKMADVVTWNAGTSTVGLGVYDYDASGKMPFMRIEVSQENDVDNSAKPIKVVVIPH